MLDLSAVANPNPDPDPNPNPDPNPSPNPKVLDLAAVASPMFKLPISPYISLYLPV